MEGLNNLLNVGADGLEGLFIKLSEVLGIGVGFIQENAMEYILMYGKYQLTHSIVLCSSTLMIIAFFIGLICVIGYWANSNSDSNGFIGFKTIGIILSPFIGLSLIISLGQIIVYLSSPEIYSIKQVMKLLN